MAVEAKERASRACRPAPRRARRAPRSPRGGGRPRVRRARGPRCAPRSRSAFCGTARARPSPSGREAPRASARPPRRPCRRRDPRPGRLGGSAARPATLVVEGPANASRPGKSSAASPGARRARPQRRRGGTWSPNRASDAPGKGGPTVMAARARAASSSTVSSAFAAGIHSAKAWRRPGVTVEDQGGGALEARRGSGRVLGRRRRRREEQREDRRARSARRRRNGAIGSSWVPLESVAPHTRWRAGAAQVVARPSRAHRSRSARVEVPYRRRRAPGAAPAAPRGASDLLALEGLGTCLVEGLFPGRRVGLDPGRVEDPREGLEQTLGADGAGQPVLVLVERADDSPTLDAACLGMSHHPEGIGRSTPPP